MAIKLIQVGSSYQMGLTNQETQLALAYNKLDTIELLVVTGENEQYSGCFNKLTENDIKNIIINGFDVHHDFLRLVNNFLNIIHEFRPDVVSVNTNWQLTIVGISKLFSRKRFKIVYTVNGFRHNEKIKSYFARYAIGFLLTMFAKIINAPTNYVMNKFSLLKRRIVTIPLGEDKIFFDSSQKHDFSIPFNFVFPGVFRHGKNQDMLIQAFFDYVKKSNDTDSRLFLPGQGELREQAMQLAKELGLAGRVIFPGQLNRSQMVELYKKCQVAIVPSNDETFGHCIAEPLVMQCIVVSRRIGLAPDFISDGVNGFLFDGKTELVEILIKIKSMNEYELNKISLSAKETGRNFNWDDIAIRHLNEIFKPVQNAF